MLAILSGMSVASGHGIDPMWGGHMPLIAGVDHDRKEVSVVAIGQISLADVREHLLHERRDQGLSYPEFVDLRGAGLPFEPGDFQQIAEILRALSLEGPLGPAAFVVSSEADLETMRALEVMAKDYREMKTFLSQGEARAWLDTRPI
ncbi:MAG: hypothetical protein WB949_17130 [Candidatus Acidiferrales bacterium]